MNLDDFVRLPKEEVADKVQAFCDKFNDEGKKSSASNAMKALRSFLKANGFRVEELVLEDSYRAMKRPEYVPTKEEVCKMASVCGLKWRATILCLFQSGLRNSTLRALSYGMLKEQIESDVVPIKVHVTGELRKVVPDACKEGVDYWTFFGAEASEALRQYINWRKERYGKIDDDELLFPSESRTKPIEKRLRTPMDQWHLTRIVKKAARRAGIKEWQNIRAHSLRKTFRAVLDAGYIDGGQLAEDDKEYLMGHKLPGAKEPYHNANVDVLAQRYMKLRWAVEGAMSKEAKVEAIKAFARSLGIKEIEVKMAAARKAEPNLSEEEALGKIIREELGIAKLDISQKKMSRDPKKVVKEDQLEHYLAQGWDVQTVLPSGKILIRKPT
jgi:integrase